MVVFRACSILLRVTLASVSSLVGPTGVLSRNGSKMVPWALGCPGSQGVGHLSSGEGPDLPRSLLLASCNLGRALQRIEA